MKKVLFSIVAVMFLLIGMPVSAAEEKVPVYMFSKDGCSACISAQEYFAELESEYPDLFELIEIVVFYGDDWKAVSEERQELLIDVYERFNEDASKISTPTIVIGDYHTVGLPQDRSKIYNAILDVKNSKNPVDEVKKLADNLNLDIEELQEYDATSIPSTDVSANEETDLNSEGGKYDTIIIIGIFVVLIGGFAGLVIVGKK